MVEGEGDLRELLRQVRLQAEIQRGMGVEALPKSQNPPAPRKQIPGAAAPGPSGSAQGGAHTGPAASPRRPAGRRPRTPAAEHAEVVPPAEGVAMEPVPPPEYGEAEPARPAARRARRDEPSLPAMPPAPPILQDDPFGELRTRVAGCTRCGLCAARTNTVFGEGDPHTELVFVGEGPGEDEDRQGRPFVGRAGRMLTKIIQDGMKLHRHRVYICNVVKCRPPGNRVPTRSEMSVCRTYLFEQLRTIQPKVIVALGATAVEGMLGEKVAITRYRGIFREWEGIPLMPTFHPSYVIRNYSPQTRQAVWDDIQTVMRHLREQGSKLLP